MTTPPEVERDLFLREILGQPDAMRSCVAGLRTQRDALDAVRTAAAQSADPLVVTGMGSSYDAALAVTSVLAREGAQVVCATASEFLHFQSPAIRAGSVVVVISQSGLSAEAVRLAAVLRARGDVTLVSITNGLGNDLAGIADIALDMNAGDEIGPSTKTYVATMVVLAVLARVLLDGGELALEDTLRTAEAAADRLEMALHDPEASALALETWWGERERLVFVGRGAGLATAELAALVMKEAAHIGAFALESAEFRHGPMEMADPGLAVAIVDIERVTSSLEHGLARDLREAGAAVLLIGSEDADAAPSRSGLVGDPLLDAAIAAAPLLLLIWKLSTRRSAAPGEFRVGTKTTTKE
ncbi:MAG: SIS domain-containing protein [Microbacteriaceae bacterium]|nr:SIS domain-containing protein [Microbacteriaceae bacterium]